MQETTDEDDTVRSYLSKNPGLTALWLVCVALGVGVGAWVLSPFYGAWLGALAGLIGGLGTALILSANRLIA